MKKRIVLILAAAVTALSATGTVSADSGPGALSVFQSAKAVFRSTSGCITTFATVDVSRDTTRPAGAQTLASLELNRFDTCTGGLPLTPFYREDSLVLPDSAFRFDNDLDTARLDATVNLEEQNTLQVQPVALHLRWFGIGSTTRTVSDDGTIKLVQVSSSAAAIGLIADSTTSFVTAPSVDASLFLAKTKSS